jgi:hypothetical protein
MKLNPVEFHHPLALRVIEGPLSLSGFVFEGRFWPLRVILPVSGPPISTLFFTFIFIIFRSFLVFFFLNELRLINHGLRGCVHLGSNLGDRYPLTRALSL